MLKKYKQILFVCLNRLPALFSGWLVQAITGRLTLRSHFLKSRVGKFTYISKSVQVIGWNNVRIGDNSIVSEGCWLNVNFRNQDVDRIKIGNNCHVGRNNFFSSGHLIDLKDYVFTGLDCKFLSCGHDISSPRLPYISSGLHDEGKVVVGVNCWLASSVTILGNVSIGHGSVVGANSLVLNDIPPFSISVGAPAKVIKRYSFHRNEWIAIDLWDNACEKNMPKEEEYLNMMNSESGHIPHSLLSASRTFGWI